MTHDPLTHFHLWEEGKGKRGLGKGKREGREGKRGGRERGRRRKREGKGSLRHCR